MAQPERDRQIAADIARGDRRDDVAQRHGVSPSMVTYVLHRDAPHLLKPTNKEQLFAKFAKRAERAAPCVICGYWVLRTTGNAYTCDPDCSAIYRVLRRRLNPALAAKERFWNARWILRNPHKVPAHQVRNAQRIVDGDAPEAKYHYYKPGTRTRRVARLVGLLPHQPPAHPYP